MLKLTRPGPTTVSLRALPKPWLTLPAHAGSGRCEGRLIKPLILLLDVVNLADDIGTVGIAAAQADGVIADAEACAQVADTAVVDNGAGLEDSRTCNLPSTQAECASNPKLVEEGELVDVVHVEDMTSVVRAGAFVILQVVGIADLGQVAAGEVDCRATRCSRLHRSDYASSARERRPGSRCSFHWWCSPAGYAVASPGRCGRSRRLSAVAQHQVWCSGSVGSGDVA